MDDYEARIENAARNTRIIRLPKQALSAFGTTNTAYYLITEPCYADSEVGETVIREGRVIAEKPRIVTPYYLSRLEGFSADARRYLNTLINLHGPDAPGLYYTFRNEPGELSIVAESWQTVADRLNMQIEQRGDALASIIKGQDELWDVSLLKFIYELTRQSAASNASYFGSRGLLNIDASGIPLDARLTIDEMFRQALKGERNPTEVKSELDRWNAFEEYQDRFFALFRGRR